MEPYELFQKLLKEIREEGFTINDCRFGKDYNDFLKTFGPPYQIQITFSPTTLTLVQKDK